MYPLRERVDVGSGYSTWFKLGIVPVDNRTSTEPPEADPIVNES